MKRGANMIFGIFTSALALAACASAPPKQEEPLVADPPAGAAEGSVGAESGTELDRGVAFLQNEKFEDAKAHLKKAIDVDPKNAKARVYYGIALEKTGDKAGAEESHKKALELQPGMPEATEELSGMYLEDPPRPDDAIAILKVAVEKNPSDARLQTNLGYAYGLKHDVEASSRAYEAALAKGSDPQIEFAYGSMLLENKQGERAAPHLKKALDATKDDVATIVTLGRMLAASKAFGDCVSAFDRAIKLKGTEPEFYVRRGTCRHELKDEGGASSDYQEAIKMNPKFAPAHYYLGLSYLLQNKRNSAESELQLAYDLGAGGPIGKDAKAKLDELGVKTKKKR